MPVLLGYLPKNTFLVFLYDHKSIDHTSPTRVKSFT